MPHIAPSTWIFISFLSFFSVALISAKFAWSASPSFPKLGGTKKFNSFWPWG